MDPLPPIAVAGAAATTLLVLWRGGRGLLWTVGLGLALALGGWLGGAASTIVTDGLGSQAFRFALGAGLIMAVPWVVVAWAFGSVIGGAFGWVVRAALHALGRT